MTSRTDAGGMTDDTPDLPPPDVSRPDPPAEKPHPRAAVAVLCLAGIVVALMQTIIVPLIPQLPALLDADASDTTWAITITLLVGAVATPIGGRIGDMYGKRLAILASLGFVAIGSVACAVSTSLPLFIVGRGLQGLGFGIIALGISVMRDIVPPRHLASSVGTMSASLGIGGALGLPFAAVIAQHVSWHALFWSCAGAAALAAVGVALTVRSSATPSRGRFDALGAIGLAAVLVCLLLPLSKGAHWGWASPLTLGMLGGFVVLLALWIMVELRRKNPLIDIRILGRRPLLLTNLASIATGFAFYAMQLIPIQLLMAPTSSPDGFGYDMVHASLILAPSGLIMFAFSHISGRINAAFGARISLALGGVIIGAGYVVFIIGLAGPWDLTWIHMLVIACCIGAGLGIAYSAMPALIMQSVSVEQTGESNGVNALMRIIGTSTSAAVVGMLLTWSMISVTDADGEVVAVPMADGYLWASAIALVMCVVASAVALAIPSRRDFTETSV
ncbi:MFS transporter [Gordonia jinghuaiqii]|uniref:MFS transporter n=1 Tax=Gordonia jinghuaiqii TaxID=2758710 RepID=UPI002948BDD3|nr:MFS transporter [Gordonia jinghuaiqii]